MMRLRASLEGEQAQLGRVPAADVARLLRRLERAAAQAAAVVLHQPKITTGRYLGAIEQAVHFRLVGIESGSVVVELELPELPFDADEALDLEDPHLGQLALEALMEEAEDQSDPVVAEAILDVADHMLIGERYDAIRLSLQDSSGPRRETRINGASRRRLREYVESARPPASREDEVLGVLFEANFERGTAQLRTATEGTVDVAFSDEHADAIHAALRQRSTLRGEVIYDRATNVVKSVRLTDLVQGIEQLALDANEYWQVLSYAELAAQQGAGHPVDPSELYDNEASDEERDAFMAAIAELG